MKKYALPAAAALLVIVAMIVLVVVPRGGSAQSDPADGFAERDENGNVVVQASALSTDQISFLKLSTDSRIELIAIRGEDGNAYAALGTCQSCNGSPNAYYTQTGNMLQCNNCGLTFPLSVIGVDGVGCHPIMLDDSIVQRGDGTLVINAAALSAYEPLFERVAAH